MTNNSNHSVICRDDESFNRDSNMKLIKLAAAAGISLLASATQADIQVMEGIVSFEKGAYQLVSTENKQALSGLSMDELRAFEGLSVTVSGELADNGKLEVYKVQQSVAGELITAYDWEVVNNELYEN